MINRFTRLFTVLILFFFSTPVLSQSEAVDGYSIRHFTDEDGLPQNSINDLLFDKDGYLWLASQVGLVRFNGSSFNLYYPDDKPAMESNITTLGKDEKGLIYSRNTCPRHSYLPGRFRSDRHLWRGVFLLLSATVLPDADG